MNESDKCLFATVFSNPQNPELIAEDIGGATYCNATACYGLYDVIRKRVHGECVQPQQLRPLLGDEAQKNIFGEMPASDETTIKESTQQQPFESPYLQDDNLGHIGRGAIMSKSWINT